MQAGNYSQPLISNEFNVKSAVIPAPAGFLTGPGHPLALVFQFSQEKQ